MSIVVNWVSLSEEKLEEWCQHPDLLNEFYTNTPIEVEVLDVDKSWEALAWLLSPSKRSEKEIEHTGGDVSGITPDLMSCLIEGRAETKEPRLDFGYGPSCILSRESVSEAGEKMQEVVLEDLRRTYAPHLMDKYGIYPQIWSRDGDKGLHYLILDFERLRGFFIRARERSQKVVVFYS